MKIGLIARADQTGLSVQTYGFWKHLKPDVTLVLDLTTYGASFPDLDMYPGAIRWKPHLGRGSNFSEVNEPDISIDQMLENVDVVFTCETPYNYYLFDQARRKNVKTVLQPNFEFLAYLQNPMLPQPDVFALPSKWNIETIKALFPGKDVRYVPVPVDQELLPYKEKNSLKTILHTAGTVAQPNRNGTSTLIKAMAHLTDLPIHATIYTQRNTIDNPITQNVTVEITHNRYYWDFYTLPYDMMVIPRRWGGLCLPMQEALASGMPVLMPNCSPNNLVLPYDMLVPAVTTDTLMAQSPISLYDVEPKILADRIRTFYENPAFMKSNSNWAKKWAEQNSWSALKPMYEELLS